MRAFQVYILQERLEAKDCELRNLKELLTQKEAAEERDDDDGDKEEANEGNSADVEAWDFGREDFQEFLRMLMLQILNFLFFHMKGWERSAVVVTMLDSEAGKPWYFWLCCLNEHPGSMSVLFIDYGPSKDEMRTLWKDFLKSTSGGFFSQVGFLWYGSVIMCR